MFVVKLYGFCLSIAYIAHQRHHYIEGLPTLWYVNVIYFPDQSDWWDRMLIHLIIRPQFSSFFFLSEDETRKGGALQHHSQTTNDIALYERLSA